MRMTFLVSISTKEVVDFFFVLLIYVFWCNFTLFPGVKIPSFATTSSNKYFFVPSLGFWMDQMNGRWGVKFSSAYVPIFYHHFDYLDLPKNMVGSRLWRLFSFFSFSVPPFHRNYAKRRFQSFHPRGWRESPVGDYPATTITVRLGCKKKCCFYILLDSNVAKFHNFIFVSLVTLFTITTAAQLIATIVWRLQKSFFFFFSVECVPYNCIIV